MAPTGQRPDDADAEAEAAGLLGAASPFEQEVLLIEREQLHGGGPPKPPLWTWLLLVAAVLAVSSAAVVFALMREVPPITLAAWRLQLTSVFLGIGAAVQAARMPAADRARLAGAAPLLAAGGASLAVHFGTWVYSLQATSVTHSLLFVSATPLFLALLSLALREPISRGELAGVALGTAGCVLLATAAARSDTQVTLRGDMAALAASLCFVGYLLVGRRLRAWMPAFLYAFGVTGLAALLLSLAALLFEGASLAAVGEHGVLGWAASTHHLPHVLYLAIVPGIVGHTGFNTLLRHHSPLVISLACNLEPLLGSLMGWLAGIVAPPGPWTWVGGALVLASTAAVSLASHQREQRQAGRAAAAAALKRILGGDGTEAAQAEADGQAAAAPSGGSGGSSGPGRSDSAADGAWGRLWLQEEGAATGGGSASPQWQRQQLPAGKPPDGVH